MIDSQPDRHCSCCRADLPASFFPISGPGRQCRSCRSDSMKSRRKLLNHPAAEAKWCNKCCKTLPGSSFSLNRGKPFGLQTYCKGCSEIKDRDGRARMRSVPHLKSMLPSSRTCFQCAQDKPLTEFCTDIGNSTGVQSTCKMCHRKYERKTRKIPM